MADEHVETPLHRACGDEGSTLEDIQRLIDDDPQALTKCDWRGFTPLHMACIFLPQPSAILQVLLDRSPTEVLGMRNRNGETPLHFSCSRRVSIDIIRRMIQLYPKALRIFDKDGYTPLYCACCFSATLEILELLVLHCPEVCLLLNNVNKSPYDKVVEFRSHQPDVVALLRTATINTVIAFFVCVHQTLVTVSPTMLTCIRQVVPGVLEEGSSISYMNGNEAIRQALANHDTLMTLLQNDELQTLLKEEANQDLIRIMWHLVIAGSRRNNVNDDESTIEDHVRVLEAVSDQPDCLYLHLRNHLFSLLPDQDEAVV
jgi:hypothetical protein